MTDITHTATETDNFYRFYYDNHISYIQHGKLE